jgi:hypothetical protein
MQQGNSLYESQNSKTKQQKTMVIFGRLPEYMIIYFRDLKMSSAPPCGEGFNS